MVFIDTGAWFALHVPTDPNHHRAVDWMQDNEQPLVTSDYVVDETLTLLCVRREPRRAIEVGRLLLESGLIRVHHVAPDEFHRAWILFQRMYAAGWSFTDCTAKSYSMDSPSLRRSRSTITFGNLARWKLCLGKICAIHALAILCD